MLVIISSISCQKKKYTNADLSFKLISASSLYGADEIQIQKFEKILDSIKKDPNAEKQDIEMCNYFSKLQENNLLMSPYIYLQINRDSSLMVFLSEDEYKKVDKYRADDLLNRNKKVSLKLDIEKKNQGIYLANKIISVKEIDGQTIVVK